MRNRSVFILILYSKILYVISCKDNTCKCGIDSFNQPIQNQGRRRRYVISKSKMSCEICPVGRYMDKLNHIYTECFKCPSGTTKTNPTTIDQYGKLINLYCTGKPCFAGSYGINNKCVLCPVGKYSTKSGLYSCDTCPIGKYSFTNSSKCNIYNKCKIGEGMSYRRSSWTNCTKCQVGQYQPINNTYTECKLCTKKLGYQNKIGQSACIKFNSCGHGTMQHYNESMQHYKNDTLFTNRADSYCTPCLDIHIQYYYLVVAIFMTCILLYILLLFIFINKNKIELSHGIYMCTIACCRRFLTIMYRMYYIGGIIYTIVAIYYMNCIQLNEIIYTYNIIIVYDIMYFYTLIKHNLENGNLEKKHLLFRK